MPQDTPIGIRTVEIFVSYSAQTAAEKDLADRLMDLLTTAFALPPDAVFAYTVPGRGATSGSHLFAELKAALAQSSVVLAVVTPAAAESSYTQFEVAASDLNDKYRVPLLPDASFAGYLPAVFKDITGITLGSIGEICQLLADLRRPLGREVEPACLWITKAERVVTAARAVAGKLPIETTLEQLQGELKHAQHTQSAMRSVAVGAGVVALVALAIVLWLALVRARDSGNLKRVQADLIQVSSKVQEYERAVASANRRNLLLPALKIEGKVATASGEPAAHALVVACAAVPTRGTAGPNVENVCPEQLRLNLQADSDGTFGLDLRSLPLPETDNQAVSLLGAGPLEEIWLIAEQGNRARVERVKTVLDRTLTLK